MKKLVLFAIISVMTTVGCNKPSEFQQRRIIVQKLAEKEIAESISESIARQNRERRWAAIISQINDIREEYGLRELKINDKLVGIAKADTMVMEDSQSTKTALDVIEDEVMTMSLEQSGIGFSSAGKNVAFVSPEEKSLRIVDAWMLSKKHRQNILNPYYTHCGAYVRADDKNNAYICAIFVRFDPTDGGFKPVDYPKRKFNMAGRPDQQVDPWWWKEK